MCATTKDKIEVMTAWTNGQEIEFKRSGENVWELLETASPVWNWAECNYRIKKVLRIYYVVRKKERPQSPLGVYASEVNASKGMCGVFNAEVVKVVEVDNDQK